MRRYFMEKYLINPNQKIAKINKDIYGHFSEHLGRCIYDGIYVGEDSKIPNVNGMRCDWKMLCHTENPHFFFSWCADMLIAFS